jgi:hypothetical protein
MHLYSIVYLKWVYIFIFNKKIVLIFKILMMINFLTLTLSLLEQKIYSK